MNEQNVYDLIVVGSGAAGMSAAIYAGRYKMKTLVFGDSFGGYTTVAGPIGNYPGYTEIDGFDLMMKMKEQAEALGAIVKDEKVTVVESPGGCFSVKTQNGNEYFASTVIFATGSEHRRLGLPNEEALTSKGVHYCATCDGPVYNGKVIAMVGGGDSSVKGANLTAEYAKKIYLISREKEIHAEPINQEQMNKLVEQGKIELILENEVGEIVGTDRLEKVILKNAYNGSAELDVAGLFIEIGATPRSNLAKGLGMELDERGHIVVTPMMETNVLGAYAAGDVTPLFGGFKQDITAA
ncbi:MAG: FAD-dependent oxidoreductase, partial [Patescibacteria group bacterium]